MEVTKSIRYRSKISTTAKGVQTPEFTVETVEYTLEEHLAEVEKMNEKLRIMFPVILEVK